MAVAMFFVMLFTVIFYKLLLQYKEGYLYNRNSFLKYCKEDLINLSLYPNIKEIPKDLYDYLDASCERMIEMEILPCPEERQLMEEFCCDCVKLIDGNVCNPLKFLLRDLNNAVNDILDNYDHHLSLCYMIPFIYLLIYDFLIYLFWV